MSTKGRVSFTVAGAHPLLYLVRDRLIQQGFALIPWDDECSPDFCLVGAESDALLISKLEAIHSAVEDTNVVLLSSSAVYSDKDPHTHIVGFPTPMREGDHVPMDIGRSSIRAMNACVAEHLMLSRTMSRTLVIRPFNVYGPSIQQGVVHEFITAAQRKEELPMVGPGYQVRCFIHEYDFFYCFNKLFAAFLNNKGVFSGVYNIGNPESISLNHLAKSVWNLVLNNEEDPIIMERDCYRIQNTWKLPSIDKVKKAVKWKPRISIRKGIWMVANAASTDE